jgi:hypothetical protein
VCRFLEFPAEESERIRRLNLRSIYIKIPDTITVPGIFWNLMKVD